MKLDDVRIGVRPGSGIVARVPGAVLVVPFDDEVDQDAVDRLLEECRKGRVARRLEELRAVAGAGVPSFAIVAEVGDTLGVFAAGDASVPMVGADPVVRLSGRLAGGWTLLVPPGFGSLEVGALDDAMPDPRLDLLAGVVPGRGVVVLPMAPMPMGDPEMDDDDLLPAGAFGDGLTGEGDVEEELWPDAEMEDDSRPAAEVEEVVDDLDEDEDEDDLDEDDDDDDESELEAEPDPEAEPARAVPAPASQPPPVVAAAPAPAPVAMAAPARASRRRRGQAAPAPEPVTVAAVAERATATLISTPATGVVTPPIPEVWGIRCKKGHFNDPAARYCGMCGIHMVQDKVARVKGPRPVLGFLVFDDGTSYKLDSDYILGSDPSGHEAVVRGRARPLVVKAEGDIVSPVHARVDLQDWDVFVSDCGSVYGTYVWSPGSPDWQRLTPADEIKLGAGSQVMIAQRGFMFQPANKR